MMAEDHLSPTALASERLAFFINRCDGHDIECGGQTDLQDGTTRLEIWVGAHRMIAVLHAAAGGELC